MQSTIQEYLQSSSRNKIIFHKNDIENLQTIDVGYCLAKHIQNLDNSSNFSLFAKSNLNDILNASIFEHSEFGKILSLKNLGILFEPSLKLNFSSFIEDFSRGNCLFIKWEGDFDMENLYFLSRPKGVIINIKNLSYIYI